MNESKKIEPTDAMVEAVELTGTPSGTDARAIMRAALNHPDAAELLASEWKANAEAAAREQGWDEAANWSIHNINDIDAERIRAANPHRPAPPLPAEDGAVIVPAGGHERIEAGGAHKFTAETATWDAEDQSWIGLWRDDHGQRCRYIHGLPLTPGTWQEAQ